MVAFHYFCWSASETDDGSIVARKVLGLIIPDLDLVLIGSILEVKTWERLVEAAIELGYDGRAKARTGK